MNLLYWIFGVDGPLRKSMPWLSVHDEGLNRGWTFVLALMGLGVLFWVYKKIWPGLLFKRLLALVALKWSFFLLLFFILVHPVLVLSGEEVAGLPEIEKIDLAASPWLMAALLLVLCTEWWLRRNWRLK